MMFEEVIGHLRRGKIARFKNSCYAIDENGNLVRVHSKLFTIQGIAKLDGATFARSGWFKINEKPIKEEK